MDGWMDGQADRRHLQVSFLSLRGTKIFVVCWDSDNDTNSFSITESAPGVFDVPPV